MVLMHEELANKEVTIGDEDCGLVIAAVIRSIIYNLHLHIRSVCCAGLKPVKMFKMSSFYNNPMARAATGALTHGTQHCMTVFMT